MSIATGAPARAWVALAVLVAIVAAAASGAAAHAIVVGVDPADGAVVSQAPEIVTVRFTEGVSVASEGNAVLDADAVDVAVGVEVVDDELRFTMAAEVADGSYVVTWHVISADSHPVTGSSLFHVGAPSVAGPAAVPVADGATGITAIRGLATAVLWFASLTAVGAGWFARRWSAHNPAAEGADVDRLVGASVATGLVALVVVGLIRVVELDGSWVAVGDRDSITRALDGSVGWSLSWLATGLIVVGLAGRSGRGRSAVWAMGAIAVVAGAAVEGHTRTASPTWLVVAGDVAHVGAAATWLGGVAALATTRASSTVSQRRTRAADVSMHAVVAVMAVTVTGLAMAAGIAPDVGAFATTRWGRAILVKVGLVALLAGIGWYNRIRLVPRLALEDPDGEPVDGRLRAVLRAELVVFAAVLVATGVVVGSSPVDSLTRPAPASSSQSELVDLTSGVGTVRFAFAPAAVGYNDLYLQLNDSDGRPLATLFAPTASLAEPSQAVAPLELRLHEVADGTYHVPVQVPFRGRWEITVEARTGTFESGSATITVAIDR